MITPGFWKILYCSSSFFPLSLLPLRNTFNNHPSQEQSICWRQFGAAASTASKIQGRWCLHLCSALVNSLSGFCLQLLDHKLCCGPRTVFRREHLTLSKSLPEQLLPDVLPRGITVVPVAQGAGVVFVQSLPALQVCWVLCCQGSTENTPTKPFDHWFYTMSSGCCAGSAADRLSLAGWPHHLMSCWEAEAHGRWSGVFFDRVYSHRQGLPPALMKDKVAYSLLSCGFWDELGRYPQLMGSLQPPRWSNFFQETYNWQSCAHINCK